ncbi:hypothetical protein KEM55_005915 [Ascosphaera atra]|nr:hypothetical protein KEM55_005915 [Ascosphaera atra]
MVSNFFSSRNPFGFSSSKGAGGDKRPHVDDIPEEEEPLKSPTQATFCPEPAEPASAGPAELVNAAAPEGAAGGSFPGERLTAQKSATSSLPRQRSISPSRPSKAPFTGDPFDGAGSRARARAASPSQPPEYDDGSSKLPPHDAAATAPSTGDVSALSAVDVPPAAPTLPGDVVTDQPEHYPPPYVLGRRTSVSAESMNPATCSADSWAPPHHPKTPEQLARLEKSIASNILFRNLDEEQMRTVLDALVEKPIPAKGIKIIAQGDVGDFFYVIESGLFDVYKHQSGSVQSGKGGLGQKVATLKEGEFFGELALMYNAPRSASVVSADAKSTLWALDRVTFRRILMDSAFQRRRMYEAFLEEVPILEPLKSYERSKVADALRTVKFNPGETIINEGEPGDRFYLLEAGTANAYKSVLPEEEQPVMRYRRGDYFGELALLEDRPRQATVIAESEVKVAMLDRDGFQRLLGPVQGIMRRTSYDAGRPFTAEASPVGTDVNLVSVTGTGGGSVPAIPREELDNGGDEAGGKSKIVEDCEQTGAQDGR